MNPSIERWMRDLGTSPVQPRQREPEVRLRLVMLQPPREQRSAPDYDPNGPVGRRARRANRRGTTDIFGGRTCCGKTADSIQRKIDGHHVRVPHTEVCATCGAVWQVAVDLGGALGG